MKEHLVMYHHHFSWELFGWYMIGVFFVALCIGLLFYEEGD